jgi:hypothetical protein
MGIEAPRRGFYRLIFPPPAAAKLPADRLAWLLWETLPAILERNDSATILSISGLCDELSRARCLFTRSARGFELGQYLPSPTSGKSTSRRRREEADFASWMQTPPELGILCAWSASRLADITNLGSSQISEPTRARDRMTEVRYRYSTVPYGTVLTYSTVLYETMTL